MLAVRVPPSQGEERGVVHLLDQLLSDNRETFESWLHELEQTTGPDARPNQAIAVNHRLEQRLDPADAQDYAERVQALKVEGHHCCYVANCAALNGMLCRGPEHASPPGELTSVLTQEKLVAIMVEQAGLPEATLRTWGASTDPDQCCRLANQTVTLALGSRVRGQDGQTCELVWAVSSDDVDPSWDEDETRDRLGTNWGAGNVLIQARYVASIAGSCHAPTVVDAMGDPRFHPSDPAKYDSGMTRDGRTNAASLREFVHRCIETGPETAATFAPLVSRPKGTQRDASEGYLEEKLQ